MATCPPRVASGPVHQPSILHPALHKQRGQPPSCTPLSTNREASQREGNARADLFSAPLPPPNCPRPSCRRAAGHTWLRPSQGSDWPPHLPHLPHPPHPPRYQRHSRPALREALPLQLILHELPKHNPAAPLTALRSFLQQKNVQTLKAAKKSPHNDPCLPFPVGSHRSTIHKACAARKLFQKRPTCWASLCSPVKTTHKSVFHCKFF